MLNKLIATVESITLGTADKELLHSNANKASERIPVMRDMVAGEVAKFIALNKLLPKDVAAAHTKGEIHYHDLDYAPLFPSYNCMLVDLKEMLTNGFKMGNAEIEEPKSIGTATAVTAQILAQVASHIYGGSTINRIDEVLAPYVRSSYDGFLSTGMQWLEDEKKAAVYATEQTIKATYDAFQSLEYEINTLHTANGQSPFCTLSFGLGTSWEARLIQKSILQVRRAGLGKNKHTAVFPKLIFIIKEGLNRKRTDPNYKVKELAMKCASERMYPDVLNYDKLVEVTGGFKTPMGCRSFLSEYTDPLTKKAIYDGRNNLGVVSINLPRIALEARGDFTKFQEILSSRLQISKKALMTRIDRFKGVKANVAPILYMYGACGIRLKADDEVMQLFTNGRATVSLGYIGLHEAANAMFPNVSEHIFKNKQKKDFSVDVLHTLRLATEAWKEETGFAFGLYSTPSESLCDRFCRIDTKEFGVVKGVTDKDYYTNSFHLDVAYKTSPDCKIAFEEPYAHQASAGFITYVEVPDVRNLIPALEYVWDYSYNVVPYFGTNTPIDECFECGFKGDTVATENGFSCPSCGNHDSETLNVTKRVCGYLGSPDARPFIKGKQSEVLSRVKHV